jgi:hypothetical protein
MSLAVHKILIGLYWQVQNTLRRGRLWPAMISVSCLFQKLLFGMRINKIRIYFTAKVSIQVYLLMYMALRVSRAAQLVKMSHLVTKRFVSQRTRSERESWQFERSWTSPCWCLTNVPIILSASLSPCCTMQTICSRNVNRDKSLQHVQSPVPGNQNRVWIAWFYSALSERSKKKKYS